MTGGVCVWVDYKRLMEGGSVDWVGRIYMFFTEGIKGGRRG